MSDKNTTATPPQKIKAIALKRIKKEFDDISKDPPLAGFSAGPKNGNLLVWEATLTGPDKTPYEKGFYKLTIEFSDDYPYKPPKFKFITKIYHMNIDDRGHICLDILKDNWSPALNVTKVLLSISSLLNEPNPEDPLVPALAKLYKEDKRRYEKTAKEWNNAYAFL